MLATAAECLLPRKRSSVNDDGAASSSVRVDWCAETAHVGGASTRPVSIILPHHERLEFLFPALKSISQWARPGDEVVVVDDGSTRQSVQEIDAHLSCQRSDITWRLVCHTRNLGGAEARNTAVRASTHDWLFCLDSDNLLTRALLSDLLEAAAVGGADVAVPAFTVFLDQRLRGITHSWSYPERPVTVRDHLGPSGVVPSASGNYLYTREAWERAGGYPTNSGPMDTWGFGLRQVGAGCVMVPAPGTYYLHRYGHSSYWSTGHQESMIRTVDGLLADQACNGGLSHDTKLRRRRRLRRSRFGVVLASEIIPMVVGDKDYFYGSELRREQFPVWLATRLKAEYPGLSLH